MNVLENTEPHPKYGDIYVDPRGNVSKVNNQTGEKTSLSELEHKEIKNIKASLRNAGYHFVHFRAKK